jgi:hypothetical protein
LPKKRTLKLIVGTFFKDEKEFKLVLETTRDKKTGDVKFSEPQAVSKPNLDIVFTLVY